MLEMIRSGKLKPERLIERTISLEEAARVLPLMGKFGSTGVLVVDEF
jgi:alcohol dehydrogenase